MASDAHSIILQNPIQSISPRQDRCRNTTSQDVQERMSSGERESQRNQTGYKSTNAMADLDTQIQGLVVKLLSMEQTLRTTRKTMQHLNPDSIARFTPSQSMTRRSLQCRTSLMRIMTVSSALLRFGAVQKETFSDITRHGPDVC